MDISGTKISFVLFLKITRFNAVKEGILNETGFLSTKKCYSHYKLEKSFNAVF